MPGIKKTNHKTLFKKYITDRVSHSHLMPRLPAEEEASCPFYSIERPTITPSDYVERIFRYSDTEDSAYKIAVRIMEVVAQGDPKMRINIANVNRIAITALTMGAKLAPENKFFTNDFYQRVGGVATLQQMNKLEWFMLAMIVRQPRGINMISGESPDYGTIFGYLSDATKVTEAERRYRVAQVYRALRSQHPSRAMPSFPGDRRAVRQAEIRGREYRRRERERERGRNPNSGPSSSRGHRR